MIEDPSIVVVLSILKRAKGARMIGFWIPMPRSRRGRATVRTRSGRVVNQGLTALIFWGVLLVPSALAGWWAHDHGIDSPGIWLAVVGVLMALLIFGLAVTLVVAVWSSVRQLRGREPKKPWFTTTYEHEDVDPNSWKIPKVW